MSLPAAQQRALDAMADRLHASEPRLTAMFATFTSLTRNEAWPGREQLPDRFSFQRLLAWLLVGLWARPVRYVSRSRWRRVLIISPVVVAMAAGGLLLGLGSRGEPGRPACQRATAAISRLGGVTCHIRPPHFGTTGVFAR